MKKQEKGGDRSPRTREGIVERSWSLGGFCGGGLNTLHQSYLFGGKTQKVEKKVGKQLRDILGKVWRTTRTKGGSQSSRV